MADPLDPTLPAPTPAGSLPAAIPSLVPERPTPQFPGVQFAGTLPGDVKEGEFTKQYQKAFMERHGFQGQDVPNLRFPVLNRNFTPLGPMPGQTIDPFPEGQGAPVSFDWGRITDPGYNPIGRAFRIGFGDTLIGSLGTWIEMNKAVKTVSDPTYDPFRDKQILDAGLTGQMALFYGSQSAEHSRWLIEHIKAKERDADWLNRSGVVGGAAAAIGGILGDPLTYLPQTLGVRALDLLGIARATRLAGNEVKSISAVQAGYGRMANAAANMAVTGAFMVAENAMTHQLDPTISGEITTDLILPVAIAGSIGLLTGVSRRYTGRPLHEQVGDPDFLKATGPRGALFEGPPAEARTMEEAQTALRAEAEARRVAAPPPPSNDGNFPPGSLATDYGPMRTQEHRTNGHAPGFDQAPTGGIGTVRTATQPDYRGVAFMDMDGVMKNAVDFPVGHRFATQDGHLWEVAAGTREGDMKRFFRTVGEERKPTPTSTRDVDREFRPGELQRAGRTTTSEHLAAQPGLIETAPRDLGPGLGTKGDQQSFVVMPDGRVFEISRSFKLTDDEKNLLAEINPQFGEHAALFARFPDLPGGAVRVTRYEDSIAGDLPSEGLTRQQNATLRRIESGWKREGLGSKAMFPGEEAMAASARPAVEGVTVEGAHQPGSVGAQLSPQSAAYQQSVLLAQGRLAPTGIGLEKLPINPVVRAFQGASVAAMRFVADLVSTGGLQTIGNKEGIANLPPVEAIYQMNWNKRLVDSLRYRQDQWSAYRQKMAGGATIDPADVSVEGRSDWRRTREQVGTALKDKISAGEKPLSFEQFRIRVAEALNKKDADEITDAASPYVNASAAYDRAHIYNHARDRAIETGIFDEVHAKAVWKAQSELRAVEKEADEIARRSRIEKWPAQRTRDAEEALIARTEDAQFKAKQMEQKLEQLKQHGPLLNGTAPSFRPRLWDSGALIDKEQRFFDKVVPWFQSAAGGSLDQFEAVRITKKIHELLSHQNPIYDRGDMKDLFMSVAGPGSAHARSFTIPDELVREFLVNDADTLARFHVQQMGKAIEFKERFGSLDAAEQIAEIERDYRTAIEKANAGSPVATEEAIKLTAQMKTAIADAQALRDKYYGTYGASPDPHRWDSRTIRMAKQFNNLTLLGMSGVSALGDLIRPLMTEGIDAFYGYGIRSLMSESRATIMRMNKAELELQGNGMELQLNVRALAASDTGDVFGSRNRFEHGLNQANSWMFVANGLNAVNQIDKEWAHLSIAGRVNHVLLDLLADVRFSERDRGRFAAVGIDEVIGKRIAIQLNVHGVDFGSGGNALTMANTTKWTDDYARDVYRSAMNQMVNRTVPTPGIGDRPNWISTEWGGLIGQYKSFGMGALVRGAYSGLQEEGNRFWYGAGAAVGFAILLNEVRSQLFYDKSTFDKPVPAVIVDGIDRSGVLGWFSDVNRAVEVLSGHRAGIKPMLGASEPRDPSASQVAGTLGGPTAGQAVRAVSVANDFATGHPTATTMRNWRALTPGGNLPYTDPIMDAVFGSGATRRPKEKVFP